jgi:hypothetical protein
VSFSRGQLRGSFCKAVNLLLGFALGLAAGGIMSSCPPNSIATAVEAIFAILDILLADVGPNAALRAKDVMEVWSVKPAVVSVLRSPRRLSTNGTAPPERMLNEHQAVIRAELLRQGLSEQAIDELLRSRWAEGTQSNLASAWAQWAKFCVRRTAEGRPVSVLDPSPVELVDFLSEVRSGIRVGVGPLSGGAG